MALRDHRISVVLIKEGLRRHRYQLLTRKNARDELVWVLQLLPGGGLD